MVNKPRIRVRWWCEPLASAGSPGVMFHLNIAGPGVGHAYTQSRYDRLPDLYMLPSIFHRMVGRLIKSNSAAAPHMVPFVVRSNGGWRLGPIPRDLKYLTKVAPMSPADKLGTIHDCAAFLKFARQERCNITISPYPDSFRVFKYDRTQHMLEGWQAHAEITSSLVPEPLLQLLEDLNAAREDIDHLRNTFDGLGPAVSAIEQAMDAIKFYAMAKPELSFKELHQNREVPLFSSVMTPEQKLALAAGPHQDWIEGDGSWPRKN